jgi:hypothetical protein
MLMSEKEDDWRKPFIDFILDQLVPNDKAERERITRRSAKLRRDWYQSKQKSRLHWFLNEVHLTIRRSIAPS